MTIKEIRNLTGLSQAKFCDYYGIPLSTLAKWESGTNAARHSECPVYLLKLLERAVRIDFKIED
ncbi:MAG: helix-turn-helix domain-containing protein [Eubacterium sp.]|nr:helix-turn-helix domain-containing protein [Eubacterium sp.]